MTIFELMRRLSERAFAIMAVCEETRKYFGITVDEDRVGQYRFVWSFKIDKEKGHKEGYDSKSVSGSVTLDDEYPGCPYCGEKRFYICQCGKIVCHHGQRTVTCPSCGSTGELVAVERIDLKGGGY